MNVGTALPKAKQCIFLCEHWHSHICCLYFDSGVKTHGIGNRRVNSTGNLHFKIIYYLHYLLVIKNVACRGMLPRASTHQPPKGHICSQCKLLHFTHSSHGFLGRLWHMTKVQEKQPPFAPLPNPVARLGTSVHWIRAQWLSSSCCASEAVGQSNRAAIYLGPAHCHNHSKGLDKLVMVCYLHNFKSALVCTSFFSFFKPEVDGKQMLLHCPLIFLKLVALQLSNGSADHSYLRPSQ